MINGIPVNSGSTGSFDFSSLPTAIFSGISVTRGGASALYGSNAISGAINMNISPFSKNKILYDYLWRN